MRWYINEASLQGQFNDPEEIRELFRELIQVRRRSSKLRHSLHITRMLPQAPATPHGDVRALVGNDRDLRSSLLRWLDSTGPFVEDDRVEEIDDYFECLGVAVTYSGLGEAARRLKRGDDCASFSFEGGEKDFAQSPLTVIHGLPEAPFGEYSIRNLWELEALEADVIATQPTAASWSDLVEVARDRFKNLEIGDIHLDPRLMPEPFEASIANSALDLLALLNEYVANRTEEGAEDVRAREIVEQFFSGKNARFSAESESNCREFKREMTFMRDDGTEVFADHHGKIRHRVFRMHFEWPLHGDRKKMGVFYLGPKLTKD